jgi:uncharacterized protein YabE (DUF348 family)
MGNPSADRGIGRGFVRRLAGWGRRLGRRLIVRLPLLFLAGCMTVGYFLITAPVSLSVNGQRWQWQTRQATVRGLLREAGLVLEPQDIVRPAPEASLGDAASVEVTLARPVTVEADGRQIRLLTHAGRLGDIAAEAGVMLKPRDELLVDGVVQAADAPVPSLTEAAAGEVPAWPADCRRPPSLHLVVRRSVPVTLVDGGLPVTFYTTRATVGEALLAQGILLYLGDVVSPGLGSRVVPGLRVYVQRSAPVSVHVDGRTLHTRTLRRTVGDVLAEQGVALMGRDYTLPPVEARVVPDMTIQVVRVTEAIRIEQETTPYETEWIAAPDLPLDTQQVIQPGSDGVTKWRYRVVLENGQPVSTTLEDQWLDSVASTKVVAYGTRIVVQQASTPQGPIEYWRRFRVLATSYNPASSGKSKDHPRYGMTRIGVPAGRGVIAVDPKVIPLGSRVYVPGYGIAVAGDTGGSILGRHIDLGYNDDEPLPHWYRWVDVYLLTPVPARGNIRYVLPNWPQER